MDAWSRLFGHLHPLLVHLPIACTLLAVLAEVLTVRDPARWRPTVRLLLVVGVLSAVGAVATGLRFAMDEEEVLVPRHRAFALAAFACLAITLALDAARARRPGFQAACRAALVASALLIGATGHVGGQMVFGERFLMLHPPSSHP
jgi:uncharacterized membrane protein